jgi:DNA-binding PadR family transcriptional regulator
VALIPERPPFWTEPKRLIALGWITSEKQPSKTRNRTTYHLTAEGREALRDWLCAPAGYPKLQHEASVRLFAGDMIEDEEILDSIPWRQIAGMRDKLIHEYFGVDLTLVWDVVEREPPTLRPRIAPLLESVVE